MVGGQGGPSLPPRVPCTPGSYPFFSWPPPLKPFNLPLFLPLSTILEPTPPALSSSLFRIPLLLPILQDPRAVPLLKITMGIYKQEKSIKI